jgi:hypothetical protein
VGIERALRVNKYALSVTDSTGGAYFAVGTEQCLQTVFARWINEDTIGQPLMVNAGPVNRGPDVIAKPEQVGDHLQDRGDDCRAPGAADD